MTDSAAPAVALSGISKRYGDTIAARDVTLALHAGRITCLLGPSGCGKSTLLRLVAGLEPVDAGEIAAEGRIVSSPGFTTPPERRNIGLVFQDFALFPHLDVLANVGFGLDRLDRRARRERALALLDLFKLGHRADAWPHTLSGGEQQRVAIARALAREPAALLLDEPFSGLDGDLKAEVRQVVLSGLQAAGAAVLIVTHDPEEAMLMADVLALMDGGHILQTGSAAGCYLDPVSLAAARLLGPVNAVPAEVSGGIARTAFGDVPAAGAADGPALLAIRPEAAVLAEEGAEAAVTSVRFGGAFHELTVEAGSETLVLRQAGPPPPAGPARVRIDPARARLLPRD